MYICVCETGLTLMELVDIGVRASAQLCEGNILQDDFWNLHMCLFAMNILREGEISKSIAVCNVGTIRTSTLDKVDPGVHELCVQVASWSLRRVYFCHVGVNDMVCKHLSCGRAANKQHFVFQSSALRRI